MEYVGAADYFFWKGVKASGGTAERPIFFMNNATTEACLEAFDWGVAFGHAITGEEYDEMLNLTTIPEPVKIEPEVEEEIKSTLLPNMTGNC